MLKVLWVNNIAIPQIAETIGMQSVYVGGWMVKLADEISSIPDIDLTIAFPFSKEIEGEVGKLSYYSFNIDSKKVKIDSIIGQDKRVERILENVNPDIIHIFGTEYAHCYVFTSVAKKLGIIEKTVISIQGLKSIYAKHYEAYLPHNIVVGHSIRDLYKGNVLAGKKLFEKMGEVEKEAIRSVRHLIGRTDWDKACTYLINPNAEYHFNSEMLRDSFYIANQWNYNECAPHSIFVSQATQPLKGLHIAIEAVSLLKPFFPDISIRIAGRSYTQKRKFKLSKYEQYVLGMINAKGLENNIFFTGLLNEQQMVEEYRRCNAFVCASSIENSPNSLCEAMMLGVPIVTSLTGGIENLLKHNEEGYVYQADAPYMLAFYLKKIFDAQDSIAEVGNKARETAIARHDVSKIVNELMNIYYSIRKE